MFFFGLFRHEPGQPGQRIMFLLDWLTSLLRLLGLSSKKARIVILGACPSAIRSAQRGWGSLLHFLSSMPSAPSLGRATWLPGQGWSLREAGAPARLSRLTALSVIAGLQVSIMRANLPCSTSSAATRFEPSCPLRRPTPKHFRLAASLSQRGTSAVTNRSAACSLQPAAVS